MDKSFNYDFLKLEFNDIYEDLNKLKDQTNLLLMGASTISPELAITREGDVVEIEYIDANNQTKTIVSFDNLNYVQ